MNQDHSNYKIGIIFGIICYVFFSFMDASIKYTLTFFSIYLPLLYFYVSSILSTVLLLVFFKKKMYIPPKPRFWFFTRVISSALWLNLVFYVVSNIPLTTYYAIVFTSPIIASILASIFLGEKFNKDKVLALFFGFSGVLIILNPFSLYANSNGKIYIMLVAFFISILSAFNNVVTCKYLKKTPNISIILYQFGFASLFGFVTLKMTHHSFALPSYYLLINIFVIVCFVFLSYLFFNLSLQKAPIQIITPIEYTQMFWGVLFGILLFNNKPELNVIAGALIIICINLYIFIKYIFISKTKVS